MKFNLNFLCGAVFAGVFVFFTHCIGRTEAPPPAPSESQCNLAQKYKLIDREKEALALWEKDHQGLDSIYKLSDDQFNSEYAYWFDQPFRDVDLASVRKNKLMLSERENEALNLWNEDHSGWVSIHKIPNDKFSSEYADWFDNPFSDVNMWIVRQKIANQKLKIIKKFTESEREKLKLNAQTAVLKNKIVNRDTAFDEAGSLNFALILNNGEEANTALQEAFLILAHQECACILISAPLINQINKRLQKIPEPDINRLDSVINQANIALNSKLKIMDKRKKIFPKQLWDFVQGIDRSMVQDFDIYAYIVMKFCLQHYSFFKIKSEDDTKNRNSDILVVIPNEYKQRIVGQTNAEQQFKLLGLRGNNLEPINLNWRDNKAFDAMSDDDFGRETVNNIKTALLPINDSDSKRFRQLFWTGHGMRNTNSGGLPRTYSNSFIKNLRLYVDFCYEFSCYSNDSDRINVDHELQSAFKLHDDFAFALAGVSSAQSYLFYGPQISRDSDIPYSNTYPFIITANFPLWFQDMQQFLQHGTGDVVDIFKRIELNVSGDVKNPASQVLYLRLPGQHFDLCPSSDIKVIGNVEAKVAEANKTNITVNDKKVVIIHPKKIDIPVVIKGVTPAIRSAIPNFQALEFKHIIIKGSILIPVLISTMFLLNREQSVIPIFHNVRLLEVIDSTTTKKIYRDIVFRSYPGTPPSVIWTDDNGQINKCVYIWNVDKNEYTGYNTTVLP